MFKKLFIGFTSVIGLMSLNSFSYASEISYTFTDSSLIRSDISHLGLDDSDYCVVNDKDYNQTDIIALSESYIESGNSKKIYNYVYFYNAYKIDDSFKSININYSTNNNENSGKTKDVDLKYISEDSSLHIIKYKFDFGTSSYEDILRNYTINSYTDNNGKKTSYDFKCTYNQTGSNVSFEYDSYIFITGKDLLSYIPELKRSENLEYESKDGEESFYYCKDDCGKALFHIWNYDIDWVRPQFFFLNFDTNKNIDKINEIDLAFTLLFGKTETDVWANEMYSKLEKLDSMTESDSLDCQKFTADNPLTITNENGIFTPNINLDGLTSNWSGKKSKYVFKNCVIPSSERLNNWSNTYFFSKLNKEDSLKNSSDGYSAYESFEKRQCSVLIDVLSCGESQVSSTFDVSEYYGYVIKDLSVMRINYDYNGTTYNARTNSGALISSSNANVVESSWFDTFIAWLTDNFPISLIIIGVVIIGLPMILSLVISLFTSGGISIISILGKMVMSIGKAISKIISFIFRLIIKCLTFIVSLPFKLLGSLFKTNNSNFNNKKKKK